MQSHTIIVHSTNPTAFINNFDWKWRTTFDLNRLDIFIKEIVCLILRASFLVLLFKYTTLNM